jgi:hypothetical protein
LATPARLAPLLAGACLAALAAPRPAAGESAVACHCFREREFDPLRPAAADPYLLATTRSSLLSAAFGVPKRSLVASVMSGTAAEDLWIAHWAAARVGRSAEALLEARQAKDAWEAALAGAGGLGADFSAALARGAGGAELAALAVDDVLAARMGASTEAVRALRSAGATSEETILASVLARRIEAPTLPLLREVKSGRASWGGVLRDAGLAPAEVDAYVRTLVRP